MYANQPNHSSFLGQLARLWRVYQSKRGVVFGVMIFGALLAFEVFNYTTTDFALSDVSFMGIRWSVILAVAFCGMDFAGVARLFTPEGHNGNKTEVWYLLGAWFLAAGMNAILTWWGVSLALLKHAELGNEILTREELLNGVPVFVAVLVVLIRILIIGTFSMAGDRLFAKANQTMSQAARPSAPVARVAPRPEPRTFVNEFDDPDDFEPRPRPMAEPRRAPPPPPPSVNRPTVASPVRPAPKPAPKPMNMPQSNGPSNGSDRNGHFGPDMD
jgi:hypothetical protein